MAYDSSFSSSRDNQERKKGQFQRKSYSESTSSGDNRSFSRPYNKSTDGYSRPTDAEKPVRSQGATSSRTPFNRPFSDNRTSVRTEISDNSIQDRPCSRPMKRNHGNVIKKTVLTSHHKTASGDEPERIAKYLARCGVGSRRDVERFIEQKRIQVNGKVLDTPAFLVSGRETILFDGKSVGEKPKPRLWRYYKPLGVITTASDPEGRETVFHTLPAEMPRVLTVGRLDINSEGLLLLTNDGSLARYMEMPSTGLKRSYRIRAFGDVTQEKLDILLKGITHEGVCYAPATAVLERVQGRNAWIHITLTEGKNREIRKLMEFLDIQVSRLIRVSYGAFQLGNLEEGTLCEVPVNMLKKHFPDRF